MSIPKTNLIGGNRGSRRSIITSLIASILGVGAVQPPPPSTAAVRSAATAETRLASEQPGARRQAPQAASQAAGQSSALGALLDSVGGGSVPIRGPGCPPDVWGRSRACAKMVRKNRLRRAGVAGARI